MDNTRFLLDNLSQILGNLDSTLKIESSANIHELKILMESPMLQIANIIYGYELRNSNELKSNYPGIDGVDINNKVMAQVTSTSTYHKIEHTIQKINEYKHHEKFSTLIILIMGVQIKLTNKNKERIQQEINNKYAFDPNKHIITLDKIYKHFVNNPNSEKIAAVIRIIDQFLRYLPKSLKLSQNLISVSFHEDEKANVFKLVKVIIRNGVYVLISSKELFNDFRNEPLKEYVLLTEETTKLDSVKLSIVILSDGFIHYALHNEDKLCHLFNECSQKEIHQEAFVFQDRIGGEFKKFKTRYNLDYKTIKTDTIETRVNELLEKALNSKPKFFAIASDEIKRELSAIHPSFGIGEIHNTKSFLFIRLNMSDFPSNFINYLILSEKYVIKESLEEFEKLNTINQHSTENLTILIPKNLSNRTRRVIDKIKEEFKVEKVFYMDEFLFDKRCSNVKQSTFHNLGTYVAPVVKCKEEKQHVRDIIYWVQNSIESRVAIISAPGGVGKTTVCEVLHNQLIEEGTRNLIAFINASQYIDIFRDIDRNSSESHIYRMFQIRFGALVNIDQKSFYLNYMLGNITFIIDGIDEVISTIPTFTIDKFISNIGILSENISKGKIIINCRDTYVNDFVKSYAKEKGNKVMIYDLLPFDKDLATEFFRKRFDDKTKIVTAMELASKFYPVTEEYRYPPFILEVITHMVDDNGRYEDVLGDFESKILLKEDSFDALIYRVCYRECIKKQEFGFQLSVDNQVRFFCMLAVEEKRHLKDIDFQRILGKLKINDRQKDVVKGLIDHPFLEKVEEDHYEFRFDFLINIFKSITIFNVIAIGDNFNLTPTEDLINTLAQDCNYNSLVYRAVLEKAKKCNIVFDVGLEYSRKAIKIISKHIRNNEMSELEKKAISNIFLLIIKSKIPDYWSELSILNYLFGDENKGEEISNFYLFDIPTEAKFYLDFNGCYFTSSEINNFPDFLHCAFDKETYFDDSCKIFNVQNKKLDYAKIKANQYNFDKNIQGDNSIFLAMNIKERGVKPLTYIESFLRLFYENNRLIIEINKSHAYFHENMSIPHDAVIGVLTNSGIISEMPGGKIRINENLRATLLSFLKQGIPFHQLNRAVTELKKRLKESI